MFGVRLPRVMMSLLLLAVPATRPTAEEVAELAASRQRYLRVLVLPGAAVGVTIITATVLLANRARRRRLNDGGGGG